MKQDSGFFFRRLVNDVSDAMIAADPDMLIREWNKAAESLYCYSRAEAQGKPMAELVRREYVGITKKKAVEFFQKTGEWNGEVFDYTSDGRRLRIQTFISKIHGVTGELIGIVAINRDITEQRRRQLRDNRNSQIYRLLAEASATCKTKVDLCTMIVDRILSIVGAKTVFLHLNSNDDQEECVCISSGDNVNLIDFLTQDTSILEQVYQRGERIYVENLHQTTKNAEWVDLLRQHGYRSMLVAPIGISEYDPVGLFCVLTDKSLDICEDDKKYMENFSNMMASALHRVVIEEQSRSNEHKLRTIFEHIIDVYFRIKPDGILETISPSGLALFRYTDEATIIGQNIRSWMFAKNTAFDLFLSDLFLSKSVKNYDFQAKTSSGETLEMEVNARFVTDSSGGTKYIEGIMRDITERKRMEAELRQKAKLENMGFLIGSVAHSFNNNLTAVLGNISLSQHYAEDNDK